MNLLKEFSLDDKCSYLENKTQSMHYKMIDNCSAIECQEFIERGYRRFGKMYFRPICINCTECQSIKIDVEKYVLSKSSKRVLKKAKNIKIYIQTPTISQAHLDLYTKYHLYMKEKKDWTYHEITPKHYYQSFIDGHSDFGYEVLYFFEEQLIGVDLIDILEEGISSIYFFYDPNFSSFSLGKLSLLKQIEFAKRSLKKWIYLGYYVEDCPSLSYKAEYTPYLTLNGKPTLNDKFKWS